MTQATTSVTIGSRPVGKDFPVFVVAELSGNHHGSLAAAIELVHAAAEAGADAVKLQTYRADTITLDSNEPSFRIGGGTGWDGLTLYQLYEKGATPWAWTSELKQEAQNRGMELFSSPFDVSAVDFLDQVGMPAYKIASFELIDIPLIRHVASKGKPLIFSTGMATLGEIEEAVSAAQKVGNNDIILLKCTSAYPSDPAEMNLRTIPVLGDVFRLPVGLSDHSTGIAVASAAVALGACMIEKHITLRRADGGPESAFALEPAEFHTMVQAVRETELALGQVRFGAAAKEAASTQFRRSLFVAADMEAGDTFTAYNLKSVRPGGGMHPRHLEEILGNKATIALKKGTALAWHHVQWPEPVTLKTTR